MIRCVRFILDELLRMEIAHIRLDQGSRCVSCFVWWLCCTDALFPAETADVLGRPGRLIKEGSSDRYVFDTTDASAHADRGQVLAANTTITRSVVAVGNNTNNRTVFWSPTGRTAPKFDAID